MGGAGLMLGKPCCLSHLLDHLANCSPCNRDVGVRGEVGKVNAGEYMVFRLHRSANDIRFVELFPFEEIVVQIDGRLVELDIDVVDVACEESRNIF